MAGAKYIKNVSGVLTEDTALQASTGAGDAGKIIALDPTGKIDNSMMPIGIGADTAVIIASEALSAGNFVNVWNNAGIASVRKSDGTTSGKEAHGFVLSAVANGANATVYFEGTNTQVTGQTPGKVFLSTTAGAATSTAPSASGNAVQVIGFAVSTTAINFDSGTPILLA
jgi:hypothetical protein